MTSQKILIATIAAVSALGLSAPVYAGGALQHNTTGSSPSAPGAIPRMSASIVTDQVSANKMGVTVTAVRVTINGRSVVVSRDEDGNFSYGGQRLFVNGKPNLGLLMTIGYD